MGYNFASFGGMSTRKSFWLTAHQTSVKLAKAGGCYVALPVRLITSYSPERPLSEERQILSYAKPPKTSRLLEGFRILGGSFCVSTGLVGLGVIGYGAFLLLQLIDAPTRDRPHYIFVGSVISLVGLLIVGFSVRWFINALRPKVKAMIDGGTPGE